MHDEAAAARLMAEVQRLYRDRTGERFTKLGLSELTGIGRTTLDNWLEVGVMPPADGMEKLATALGTPAAQMWVRWLDLGTGRSALDRIADALERAFPPPSPAEERLEATLRAERSDRLLQEAEASAAPRAPRESMGSGR